jgi:arylsulfatase A-like enzyme
LGSYGDPVIRTPNLDRFAVEGMRLDRAYVTAPQCSPSRASLFTGRAPQRIGVTRLATPLPPEVVTFPERLRAVGYFTGMCRRCYHLDGQCLSDPKLAAIYERHQLQTFQQRLDFVRVSGNRQDTVAQMHEFFDAVPDGTPFFLQVSFNDPHRPFQSNAIPLPHNPQEIIVPPYLPDLPAVRRDLALYFDAIARMDEEFGWVMEVLTQQGFHDNTLVIFMGDNGHAFPHGKGSNYQPGIHVPLLIRWPGHVRPGSTSVELISGEDIAPTVLEASGVDVPKEMTGKSFMKLLLGQPFEGRQYVFAARGWHDYLDLARSVTSRRYTLIYNALPHLPYRPVDLDNEPLWTEMQAAHQAGILSPEFARAYFAPSRPDFELYDLEHDPREFDNLVGKPAYTGIEQELKEALAEWMHMNYDYLPPPALRSVR